MRPTASRPNPAQPRSTSAKAFLETGSPTVYRAAVQGSLARSALYRRRTSSGSSMRQAYVARLAAVTGGGCTGPCTDLSGPKCTLEDGSGAETPLP